MSWPRVRTAKRLLPLGALHEKHDSAAAHWRQTTLDRAELGGVQRAPLVVPTRDAAPLSTLARRGLSYRPQHPQEPDVLPVAKNSSGHIRTDVEIRLSAAESKLFTTLLQMVKEENMGTTLRVAGGWVRDKLIGQQQSSHQRKLTKVDKMDIDIALDNCMGGDFATKLNRFLAKKGQKMGKVALVASNPEKSKHLETATVRVDGFWVDFVNLRTESYLHDSRIPSINIGTPLEDAYRRDLTINSMFYNINTGMVEDFTGRGTADLRLGLVRTPLPPCETLLDDPLRILRAVRFASRLGFDVHHELMEAGREPAVHEALVNKVSRERVGSEVDQMVRSAAPVRAFELMEEMGLLPLVFSLPERSCLDGSEAGRTGGGHGEIYGLGMTCLKIIFLLLEESRAELQGARPYKPSQAAGHDPAAVPGVDCDSSGDADSSESLGSEAGGGRSREEADGVVPGMGGVNAIGGSNEGKKRSKGGEVDEKAKGAAATEGLDREEIRRLGLYAAFLWPLADDQGATKKAKKRQVVHTVMADHLKLRVKDAERVQLLQSAATEFQRLLGETSNGQPLTRASVTGIRPPRLPLGQTLRGVGPLWRLALVLGLSADLGTRRTPSSDDITRELLEGEEAGLLMIAYASIARSVQDMGLEGVWDLKPMLNGGEVTGILPKLPRGPEFSTVMSKQIEWGIENPGATREDAAEYLKTSFKHYC